MGNWKKYRKKPVVIEAAQWFVVGDLEGIVHRYFMDTTEPCSYCGGELKHHGWIETFEGGHIVCPGDYIVRGVEGEVYPVKPSIFDKTYEAVESSGNSS